MPIEFRCPSCERKLKVPESKAGKQGKCPACGGAIQVPAAQAASNRPGQSSAGTRPQGQRPQSQRPQGQRPQGQRPRQAKPKKNEDEFDLRAAVAMERQAHAIPMEYLETKPCPHCGGIVATSAPTCQYCGRDTTVEVAVPIMGRYDGGGIPADAYTWTRDTDDVLTAFDILLCIFCSRIACIYGIICMVQGKGKGWKLIVFSLIMSVIWGGISVVVQLAAEGPGAGP